MTQSVDELCYAYKPDGKAIAFAIAILALALDTNPHNTERGILPASKIIRLRTTLAKKLVV
jgi:hypothetical protein